MNHHKPVRVQLTLPSEIGNSLRELAARTTTPGPAYDSRLQAAIRGIALDCLSAGLEAVMIQRGARRARREEAKPDLETLAQDFDPGARHD